VRDGAGHRGGTGRRKMWRPRTQAWLGRAAGGRGMRGGTALARDAEPDARGTGWGAVSGCGEVQATGAGGR